MISYFSDQAVPVLQCAGISKVEVKLVSAKTITADLCVCLHTQYCDVIMTSDCVVCKSATIRGQGKVIVCKHCSKVAHERCVNPTEAASWVCSVCKCQQPDAGELTLRDLVALISETSAKHSAELREVEANLGKSLDHCFERITAVETKVNDVPAEMADLKAERDALKATVNDLEERLIHAEQYARVNDVDVYGIPTKPNENIMETLSSLGNAVGFPLSSANVGVAHRTGPGGASNRGILVRFIRKSDKEEFMRKRKVKRDLAVKDLNLFTSAWEPYKQDIIYVNESLSATLRSMLMTARTMKREGKISDVWSQGGRLFIRKESESPKIQIKCPSQLRQL